MLGFKTESFAILFDLSKSLGPVWKAAQFQDLAVLLCIDVYSLSSTWKITGKYNFSLIFSNKSLALNTGVFDLEEKNGFLKSILRNQNSCRRLLNFWNYPSNSFYSKLNDAEIIGNQVPSTDLSKSFFTVWNGIWNDRSHFELSRAFQVIFAEWKMWNQSIAFSIIWSPRTTPLLDVWPFRGMVLSWQW